jgi:hypothetical protein
MEGTNATIPLSIQILNHWRIMDNKKKQFQSACAELDRKKGAVKEGTVARQEISGMEAMAYRLRMDYSHAQQAFQHACQDGICSETLCLILEFMDGTHNKKE